jgi:choline dehydrogenase-like flavoprotein
MADEPYDVVVAGAGVAGALIAYELSRAGVRVALVDAGDRAHFDPRTGRDERLRFVDTFFLAPVKTTNAGYPSSPAAPSPDEGALNAYFVQRGPDPFQSTYQRIVGGTTYHWLGTALRYTPDTFAEHTRFGRGADWPLTYDDLEPWYGRAETELGVSGDDGQDLGSPRSPDRPYPMPPIVATHNDRVVIAGTAGLTFDGLPLRFVTTPQARNSVLYQGRPACAGSTNCIPICPIQAKYDATVHVKRALNPRLGPDTPPAAVPATPVFGSVVTAVALDDRGRVEALEITHPDRTTRRIRGRLFVLALNAIENAKVLLMSAAPAAPRGVANGSDVVGRYLMDHDVKITYARLPVPLYPFRGPLSSAGVESLRTGPFRAERGAFRIELQNTGWSWATNSPFSVVTDLVAQGLTGRRLRDAIAADVGTQIELNGLVEPEPDPENTVRPSATLVDGLGVPRPELRYRVGEYAAAGGDAFLRAARAVYRSLGATEVSEVPGWQGAGHLMGTHRMGMDPAASCCDQYGRTHEHPNLFLAGAGLFPTVDAANPTLTIAAMALRTAAHIVDTLCTAPDLETEG